jgi:hypothetical protein
MNKDALTTEKQMLYDSNENLALARVRVEQSGVTLPAKFATHWRVIDYRVPYLVDYVKKRWFLSDPSRKLYPVSEIVNYVNSDYLGRATNLQPVLLCAQNTVTPTP